jgi:hypothetical protein
MEHQLSNAGLSIESVPEFQYWRWRLSFIWSNDALVEEINCGYYVTV